MHFAPRLTDLLATEATVNSAQFRIYFFPIKSGEVAIKTTKRMCVWQLRCKWFFTSLFLQFAAQSNLPRAKSKGQKSDTVAVVKAAIPQSNPKLIAHHSTQATPKASALEKERPLDLEALFSYHDNCKSFHLKLGHDLLWVGHPCYGPSRDNE